MMFTTLRSKFSGMTGKVVAGAAIAGAAMLMAVPAAQAQRVRFGVRIGGPVYVAPAPAYVAPAPEYVAPGYVAPGPEVVFTGPGYYDGIYFSDYNAWHAHYLGMHRYDRDHFYGRDFHGNHFGRR